MSAAADELAALYSKTNIGPKTHPEDAASDTPSEADSEASPEPESPSGNDAIMPAPSANYHMPRFDAFDANTGPKGVIADARSFERAKKQKARRALKSFVSLTSAGQAPADYAVPAGTRDGRSASPQQGDDEDEDEFMDRWRKSRLSELRSGDVRNRRASPSLRRYGGVALVDAAGYLDAIEKVGRDTVVVVCIYDDESDVSRLVEDCLSSLARKHATTRFVKLHYDEAEMDVASAPAVLAYRGGELFANLVGIVDEIPAERTLSTSSLEMVLRK
ncbi:MAG: hypothetical protein M1832_003431 [Thelocarpon impressellum]|nr:MAG: hypothetical protein M1832_003431 [Thelocarpon impressellum]